MLQKLLFLFINLLKCCYYYSIEKGFNGGKSRFPLYIPNTVLRQRRGKPCQRLPGPFDGWMAVAVKWRAYAVVAASARDDQWTASIPAFLKVPAVLGK